MTIIVTSEDLSTYLGSDVDTARATMLITQAMNLASAIVNPVPDTAAGVVLSAAGRAYVNPTDATAQMTGPYQMSGVRGGLYLTKAEQSALRRLNQGGGAFSIDLLGIDGTGTSTDYPANRFPDWLS